MRACIALALVLVIILAHQAAAAEDYPPGLMYSTLLNGVKMIEGTGQFRMDNIQAVFLPPAQSSGSIYPYNPDDGGKAWAILSTSAGDALCRFDFYGELLESPYWLLSSYRATDLTSGVDAGSGWVDLAREGAYVVDFYLESGRFFTYPFSVGKIASPDPFAGTDYWVLSGDWRDWGYFYYYDANSEQSLVWKLWLRNDQYGMHRDIKLRIEVRDSGGGLVCQSRENMTHSIRPQWTRYEFDMIFPPEGTSGGAYFKAKDLLAKDGTYTLTVSIDGVQYGSWLFSVKGGAFAPQGRTVRGQADPLTFVEGGRDAFWYGRK